MPIIVSESHLDRRALPGLSLLQQLRMVSIINKMIHQTKVVTFIESEHQRSGEVGTIPFELFNDSNSGNADLREHVGGLPSIK